jgi:linoleoyl-CoA desaturase
MTTIRVKFPYRDSAQFVDEMKARVTEYFTERGLSDKANGAMVLKSVILLGLTYGTYGLILSGWFSPWAMLGLAILMGVGVAGIGFSVSHDALHGAYSDNPRINKLIGLTFDLNGANGYMWKITHNVIHHTYTNIHGIDEDLEVSPLLRLSPQAQHRWFQRWQQYYAFLAYSFSTLFWVFAKDFKYFLQTNLGPYQNKSHPRSEVMTLVATKLIYFGYTIVLPLLVLDIAWWQFAIGYLAMHLTAGFILGIVFQLAHVVEGTEHPMPDAVGNMDSAWIIHEMLTTANFARRNRVLSWYVGGLNFQVEHHLFPKVCSVHYPAISEIVREVARKYGIPYNDHETFRDAVRSHYTMLKQLGNPTTPHAQASARAA